MPTKKVTLYDRAGMALKRAENRWGWMDDTMRRRAYRIGWLDGRAAGIRECRPPKKRMAAERGDEGRET